MLTLATERKHHVSTRPEDLACGGGSGPVGARRRAGAALNRRRRRFTAQRKAAAVQRLIRGESLEAVSRDIGVPAHRLSEWREAVAAQCAASAMRRLCLGAARRGGRAFFIGTGVRGRRAEAGLRGFAPPRSS